jgi:hypothetical protein
MDDGAKPSDFIERWRTADGDPLAYILYSSFSNTTDKPKWRAVFPLAAPVPGKNWEPAFRRLDMALFAGRADGACVDPSRMFYMPACPPDRFAEAFADVREGAPLNPSDYPEPEAEETFRTLSEIMHRRREATADSEGKPGSDFNAQATADDVLALVQRAGWREDHRAAGGVIHVTRPGKTDGTSATIGYCGDNRLYVFSGAAEALPFTYKRAYSPFAVYALLEHDGDFAAAARDLAGKGYGNPLPPRTTASVGGDGGKAVKKPAEKIPVEPEDIGGESRSPEALPSVTLSGQQREIATDAWGAVRAGNDPPTLFSRARTITRLVYDRETARVELEPMQQERMLHRLRRAANFVTVKRDKDGNESFAHAQVPQWLARDMLEDAEEIGTLPAIRALVAAPVVGPDGTLLTTPGYHADSGLFLAIHDLCLPSWTETGPATREAAREAYGRLMGPDGLFGEFPFARESDRTHAGALLLTMFLRPYISGTAPMILIEAPESRTGKSLLGRSLVKIFDPTPAMTDAPTARTTEDAEAEFTKLLGTVLKNGPSTLFLDNIRGMFHSTAMESLLTTTDAWKTRLLGSSTEVTIWPQMLTVVGTSNNAMLNRDMTGRSITVRLDANMERPEERKDFRVADLERHVTEHRAELIGDVLTILGAWIAAGRPEQTAKAKGGFERWARIVGGVLEFLDAPGFLADEEDRQAFLNPEAAAWKSFVQSWYQAHGTESKQARELLGVASDAGLIDAPEHGANFSAGAARSLGKKLQSNRDRIFGGFRIHGRSGRGDILVWSLRPVDSGNGGFGGSGGFPHLCTRDELDAPVTGIFAKAYGAAGENTHQTPQTHPADRLADTTDTTDAFSEKSPAREKSMYRGVSENPVSSVSSVSEGESLSPADDGETWDSWHDPFADEDAEGGGDAR